MDSSPQEEKRKEMKRKKKHRIGITECTTTTHQTHAQPTIGINGITNSEKNGCRYFVGMCLCVRASLRVAVRLFYAYALCDDGLRDIRESVWLAAG